MKTKLLKLSKILILNFFIFNLLAFNFIKAMKLDLSNELKMTTQEPCYIIKNKLRKNMRTKKRNNAQNKNQTKDQSEYFRIIANYLLENQRYLKNLPANQKYRLAQTTLSPDEKEIIQKKALALTSSFLCKSHEILNVLKNIKITPENYRYVFLILRIFTNFKSIKNNNIKYSDYSQKLIEIKNQLNLQMKKFLTKSNHNDIALKRLQQIQKKLKQLCLE